MEPIIIKTYYNKLCRCGCDERIEIKKNHKKDGIPNFINGHQNKGENNPNFNIVPYSKNKTFEELYGEEKAKKIRKKMSEIKLGKNNPMYGLSGKNNPNYGKKRPECSGKNHPNYGRKFPEHSNRMKSHNPMKNKESVEKRKNTIKNMWKNGEMKYSGCIKLAMAGYYKGENNPNYGRIFSEETIRKMSEMKKEKYNGINNPMFGKENKWGHHSKESIRKMSENKTGKKRKPYSKEHIRKLRISALNYVLKHNKGLSKGKHETSILDELEKLYEYKIIRQYHIKNLGYMVDGYISELNLCIEVDEKRHFDINDNLKGKDIIRQKNIENELNCKFLRIKDF